tara:strand:- start:10832 stop:11635 length:804 start_codon:yes stop_codon:yes gene_type:complete
VGIFEFTLFVLGCCVGSFLNVVIFRLPFQRSIIYPSSRCLRCNSKINWFDNVPIFSWLILQGKCRFCKNKISFQYPFIELLTGILFIINFYSSPTLFNKVPQEFVLIIGCALSSILILLSVFDYKYFWLPSLLTVSGIFLGLINALIIDFFIDFNNFTYFKYSLLGSVFGFLIFKLLSFFGKIIYKKSVLGGGDSKLVAMIGAWLGVKGMLITIWLSFYTSGLFVICGLILKRLDRKQKIPFGIFLSFNAFLVWMIGNDPFIRNFTF